MADKSAAKQTKPRTYRKPSSRKEKQHTRTRVARPPNPEKLKKLLEDWSHVT